MYTIVYDQHSVNGIYKTVLISDEHPDIIPLIYHYDKYAQMKYVSETAALLKLKARTAW